MAGEIQILAGITVRKGQLHFALPVTPRVADMDGLGGPTPGFMEIGTSEETVSFGELITEGWMIMQNLDAENYVEWGFATGVYGGRMLPGETAGPFRLNPGASLFLLADTDPCNVLIYAFEA